MIYASTWNLPRIQKLVMTPAAQVLGGNTTGVTSRLPEIKPGDAYGHLVAINPLTGQKKWEVPLTDFPSSAGMLATGGGLVFTGKLSGEFIALDEDTGKTLWQFKTGSSHQLDGDHVHPQGPSVRDRCLWTAAAGWRIAMRPTRSRRAGRSGRLR